MEQLPFIYYLSIFVMPYQVSLEFDRLLRNFFWKDNGGGKVTGCAGIWFLNPNVMGGLGLNALK